MAARALEPDPNDLESAFESEEGASGFFQATPPAATVVEEQQYRHSAVVRAARRRSPPLPARAFKSSEPNPSAYVTFRSLLWPPR